METFGYRLLRLIRDTGYSQVAFAQVCSVSPAYINDLVHGRRDSMSLDVARTMARELDCSLEELNAPVRILTTTGSDAFRSWMGK